MATAPFSPSVLSSKLRDLQNTMHSIQTLSLWITQHKRHAKHVAEIWIKEFQRASSAQQQTLLSLANDVIQNSKRKGPEYTQEFEKVLPKAIKFISKTRDTGMKKAALHIFSVWEERNVFDELFINELRSFIGEDTAKTDEYEAKRKKVEDVLALDEPPSVKPPETGELLKKTKRLFTGPKHTQNMKARKRIAELQPRVSGITDSTVAELKSREEGEDLLQAAAELKHLLHQQCARLKEEVKEREELEPLVTAAMHQCWDQIQESEQNMEETKTKIDRVQVLKEELKTHLAKLPDLSKLASTAVAPLPAAGDLFN